MALTETPEPEIGSEAPGFELRGVDGDIWSLEACRGEKGTLVMFICNHCPYVKAVISRLVEDCRELEEAGIKSVAIMSNDPEEYPEDSFENMYLFAREHRFDFPYLIDRYQTVAKDYGAVCTPDFFGFDAELKLRYRGRLDAAHKGERGPDTRRDLVEAMKQIAETGEGPAEQLPSMGCSIKWVEDED